MTLNSAPRPTDIRPDSPAVAEALTGSVAAAGLAPSIHNTQPWQWRMTGDGLDLHLEPSRLLQVTDPDTRLATLSCGAALHHARISLAAQGWRTTVTRIPDPRHPEHLAHLQTDGPARIDPATVRRAQTIRLRHTDRRPLSGPRIGPNELRAIIELTSTRQAMRVLLSSVGHPYLVLRLGTADPDDAGPAHAPRLPTDQIIDRS